MRGIILAIALLFASPFSAHGWPGVSKSDTGLLAVWADTGEVIEEYQKELALIPASTAKIITTYCALKKLGGNYRLSTYFTTDGLDRNGTAANLYVRGEGDPSLVSEKLWIAVQRIKAAGVRAVAGDIVVNDGYFGDADYPGRQENNMRAYNAPTSPVALNFNAVAVTVHPSGGKIGVTLLPDIPYFKLKNVLRPGKRAGVTIRAQNTAEQETITVGGTYPPRGGLLTFYRSVVHPAKFFGHALATNLKESGIPFNGKIVRQPGASGKFMVYEHRSDPLSRIVQDINKFSNNFMAEQITKHLGAKSFNPPGTTQKGLNVVGDCLQKAGVRAETVLLENGSGLSYRNRVSAEALVRVLLAGYHDFRVRPDYLASLSVYRVDGTMKHRNAVRELEGVLRAKTGTLNGISSLAGFMPASNGRMIAFAIVMNNLKGPAYQAQDVQDRLVAKWSR